MKVGKRGAGLCVLLVLLLSALAAQNASAVGTTAYTCKNTGPGGSFTAAHCKPSDAGSGNFSHASITNNTTTEVIVTDLNTAGAHTGATLKSTASGIPNAIVATQVSGTGTMFNSEVVGGEMVASGEGKLVYSGVTDEELDCEVVGIPGGPGVIETKQLVLTTQNQGDKVKVSPKVGNVLAEYELKSTPSGATCPFGSIVMKLVGSVLGIPDGATVSTVHTTVTADHTLRTQSPTGPFAGITGTLKISGRANSSESYTPLSVTT